MAVFAAAQFKPVKGDWTASASRLEALIDGSSSGSGAEKGHGIIICPEMALTGYVFADPASAAAVAEPSDGRTFAFAASLAAKHAAFVVMGYPEISAGGRLYNSALIIDPEGNLLYNYRKRLLYDLDKSWASPGDTPYPLIDTPWGRMTCGICMDLNDERFIEFLFDEDPELIAFPTNWLDQDFDVREYWLWRLAGYPGWLLAANTYGLEEDVRFRGYSAIIDPYGRTVALGPASGDAVITVA